MFHKWIWIESTPTPWARHKCLGIVVIKGCLIIDVFVILRDLATQHFVKVWRCLRTRSSLVFRFFFLLDIPLLFACLDVNFETHGSVLPPADVAHEHPGSQCSWRFGRLFCLLPFEAHYLVPNEWVWIESTPTPWARHKCLGVVVIKGCLIVDVFGILRDLATQHFFKVRRCLRTRSSLVFRFFFLLDVPLLFACLDVNFETHGSVLPPADVAHEHPGSQCSWRFGRLFCLLPFEAHLLMFYKSFWVKSSITTTAFVKWLCIELVRSSIIIEIHFAFSISSSSDYLKLRRWLRQRFP